MPNITKVAFKGGGAKGYIDIGVGLEFERLGLDSKIDEVAGTSVGAIFALFFASGKPAKQLQEIAFKTNFYELIENHWEIVNLWHEITKGGWHDGKALHQYIKDFVKSITGDENTTFEQWHILKESKKIPNLRDISVEACNISRGINQVFSYKNPLTKHVPIWKAIAASSAFPQYFEPVAIEEMSGELFSDGGLQNNCPIDLFDLKPGVPNPEAVGIWLATTAEINFITKGKLPPAQKLDSVESIAKAQVNALLEGDAFRLYKNQYEKYMIFCNNMGISTLDFNLTHAQKEMLVLSGIISVFQYFAKYYPEFAAQHYSVETLHELGLTKLNLAAKGFDSTVYKELIQLVSSLPEPREELDDVSSVLTPLRNLKLSTSETVHPLETVESPKQPDSRNTTNSL